jgi:hypothetical protein
MKSRIFIMLIGLLAITSTQGQKWSQLSDEEKLMKLKDFRADNQNYLKNTLGMNQTQMEDIDNVNICFLSTLDRIDRYGKDQANKEKYAKAIADSRNAQLDVIMGKDKHKKYSDYIAEKLKKLKAEGEKGKGKGE